MKRTRLKRLTPLKAKKYINPISKKQREKNAHWTEVTDNRAKEENYICQWCGEPGQRDDPCKIFPPMAYLTGHHIKKRRYNVHTPENCYISHWLCHDFIEQWNIDVREYPDEKTWQNRQKGAWQPVITVLYLGLLCRYKEKS